MLKSSALFHSGLVLILNCTKCSTFLSKKMIWTNRKALLLLLLITNIQTVKLQPVDSCTETSMKRQPARVLKGHVIMTEQTNSFEGCVDRCFRNSKCYSINYYNRKERCELNDKTTFINPEDLVRELNGTYLDILRPYSDCSDLFCDRDEICKMERVDLPRCKGESLIVYHIYIYAHTRIRTHKHTHTHTHTHTTNIYVCMFIEF